jgi:hypothetical protein
MLNYDHVILLLTDALKAQEVWPSSRILRMDISAALALLDNVTPRCEKCQCEMTRTASAPIGNSRMVWRCLSCANPGITEGRL